MKKETIEKLFKRYISIFDDVVNQTTGTHLDQTIVNEINSEVDLLFKEYEQMSNLTEFNSFSEKIQNIINKVLKESKLLNKAFIEKELQKRFNLFESNPFVYIENEVNNTINKIIPNTNGDYYIPANPYLESITRKGYNIIFRSNKIKEHIDKVSAKYKTERDLIIKENEQLYAVSVTKALQELNDYPIQFCKETFEKYFYDKWDSKLLVLPNSIKNYILIDAINLGLKPHTEEYEKAVDLIFTSKEQFRHSIATTKWDYLNDLKYNFINKNLVSRVEIINLFIQSWESLIFKNENLSKNIKNDLLRKYSIIFNNIDKISDTSIIRFYVFMNNFNGGGSYKLLDRFVESLADNSYLTMIANLVNIELTLLINELETIKFDKEQGGFISNEKKYSNIINEYYKIFGDTKSSNDKENFFGVSDDKSLTKEENEQVTKQLIKTNILYSLVETFNKHYKFKYMFENIKSKVKNIIKIKK